MPRAGEPRVEAVYCCVSATVKEAVKEIIDWISGAAVLFNQKSPAAAAATASAHPATQFPWVKTTRAIQKGNLKNTSTRWARSDRRIVGAKIGMLMRRRNRKRKHHLGNLFAEQRSSISWCVFLGCHRHQHVQAANITDTFSDISMHYSEYFVSAYLIWFLLLRVHFLLPSFYSAAFLLLAALWNHDMEIVGLDLVKTFQWMFGARGNEVWLWSYESLGGRERMRKKYWLKIECCWHRFCIISPKFV